MTPLRFLARLFRMVPRSDLVRLHEAHASVLREERRRQFRFGMHFAGHAVMDALAEEQRPVESKVGRGCCLWERGPHDRADEAWTRLAVLLRDLGDEAILDHLTRRPATVGMLDRLAPSTSRTVASSDGAVTHAMPLEAAEAEGFFGDLVHHLRLVYLHDGVGLRGDELQARLPS